MTFPPSILPAALLAALTLTAVAHAEGPPPPAAADVVVMKGDKNRDGFITRDEADAKMREHWDHWDRNGDGKIDAGEYAIGIKAGGAKP